jgi:hypothetical protein
MVRSATAVHRCNTATSTTTLDEHDRQRTFEPRDANGKSGHAVRCSPVGAVFSFAASQRRQRHAVGLTLAHKARARLDVTSASIADRGAG